MTSAEFPENMPRGAAAAEEQETTTEAGPSSQAAPSTSEATAAAAPAKKRRRPALSCEQCRRRKIRCDRNVPCSHCVKSGIGNGCHYIPTHTPASWLQGDKSKKGPGRKKKSTQDQDQSQVAQDARRPQQILPAPASGDEGNETVAQDQVAGNVDWLVTHIEERLSKVVTIDHGNGGPIPGHISILTPPSLSHSQQQSHTSSSDAADTPSSGRSVPPVCAGKCPVSRIKYLGRSHWMHGVGMFPQALKLMHPSKDGDPELVHLLSRCKTVGRRIKEVRQAPLSSTDLGNNMVPRNLADELVEAYLRTFEGVFRILHVPSFREQYAAYWKTLELRSNGDATVPPPASYFVMQLQLVLALGSAVHETGFPLKAKAARWVYEAHLWLILPPGKHRMTIPGIQNMCLLTLAQNVCGIDQDMAWITAGDLIRKAMYMGLHRDPRHLGVLTRFRAQMRRRLWATVMELNLQSAFDAGGPPLTSDMDHDVDPPGNYDDEELTDDIPDAPQQSGGSGQHNTAGEARKNSAGSATRVTQMSVALQLLESLPMRLRLLQHVNDFRAGDSYEETLRFNSELTRACRRLSRAMIDLQAASASTSTSPSASTSTSPSASATASSATAWSPPSSSPTVNLFHTSVAELLVYRCFHTLHQPVITRSLTESKYHFSRKMHLDGALKMMQICRLSGPHRSEGPGAELVPGTTDLDRLLINGSGMFRNMTLQSVPGIVVELLECTMTNQSSAQDLGLGYLPAVNDYDLRATLEAGERLSIRRIEAGETNVKCISFSGACLAHIDAAAAGLDDKATEARLLESIRKSAAMALDALTRLAEREGVMAGPSPPPVDPFAATTSLPQSGQGQAPDPFLYGSPMMPDFFSDPMSVDMMSEWMMDIDGMLWGPPQPQMDMM